MRSVSLPSKETDLYFSVTLTIEAKQPAASHEMEPLPIFVLLVEPVIAIVTAVAAQTGMRCAVHAPTSGQSAAGSIIFPVIRWLTFRLLLALLLFPIVTIASTGQAASHGTGPAVGVAAGVGVGVGGPHDPRDPTETPARAASHALI